MNKGRFIQDNFIQVLLSDKIQSLPDEKRMPVALKACEKAWEFLSENGYGARVEKAITGKKDWYEELGDKRNVFDEIWSAYGKVGGRNDAAKAFHLVDEKEYEHIRQAIPSYLEQCRNGGVQIAHFSTWLNGKRWLSFDMVTKKDVESSKLTEMMEELAGLKRQRDMYDSGSVMWQSFNESVEMLEKKVSQYRTGITTA